MTLDDFLASVERRAFSMARLASRSDTEALDIVQDSMLKLVQKYRHKPSQEWPMLFQRILQNCILDWHRQKTRSRRLFWWSVADNIDSGEHTDSISTVWIDTVADHSEGNPSQLLARAEDAQQVMKAIEQLPIRQQQAFLLRAWEGFDVAETAQIMRCTSGSVKTHYFRAQARLKILLEASDESH